MYEVEEIVSSRVGKNGNFYIKYQERKNTLLNGLVMTAAKTHGNLKKIYPL